MQVFHRESYLQLLNCPWEVSRYSSSPKIIFFNFYSFLLRPTRWMFSIFWCIPSRSTHRNWPVLNCTAFQCWAYGCPRRLLSNAPVSVLCLFFKSMLRADLESSAYRPSSGYTVRDHRNQVIVSSFSRDLPKAKPWSQAMVSTVPVSTLLKQAGFSFALISSSASTIFFPTGVLFTLSSKMSFSYYSLLRTGQF